VTFDRSSGLSRYTGQITHHITPDIDAERDGLVADLVRSRMVTTTYSVTGVGPTLNGQNGEGDRYYTDGEIRMGVLAVGGRPAPHPPTELPTPLIVSLKDAIWRRAAGAPAR